LELPVIGEMPQELASLQGLDRSWSAHSIARDKAALTVELVGFHTLDRKVAIDGSAAILRLLEAVPTLQSPAESMPVLPFRLEVFANASGLFEAIRLPGDHVQGGQTLGLIRSLAGMRREEIRAPRGGSILAMQPVSAVNPGSWLATIAVVE
jgi:predicted deacylase